MNKLALVSSNQRWWHEAGNLQGRVVEMRIMELGHQPPETLMAIADKFMHGSRKVDMKIQ